MVGESTPRSCLFGASESPDESTSAAHLDRHTGSSPDSGRFYDHRGGVLHPVSNKQRVVVAASQKLQRHPDGPRLRAIHNSKKPARTTPARERGDLSDLGNAQDDSLVPYAWNALEHLHR